jgi:3-oxoacyl-[acyl-carrier-protein] synthase-1/3-oxoacyl-[acyl-carrier-protein] synthase II
VGLALGTSSGGMVACETLFEAIARGEVPLLATLRDASYGSLYAQTARGLGVPLVREASVLVACASSTVALGLAHTWLDLDACDVVLAGGYDVLSLFVSAGFSALGATTADVPRPFRVGRDGLALSEGAAVVALVRDDEPRRSYPRITGFGLSSDAVHVTAPDRTGAGLVRAASRALAEAKLDADAIDLVSAHGTATAYNDAAEARALRALGCDFDRLVVHAPKGSLGHALGAAGVLETLLAVDAMERSILPATAGGDAGHPIDVDAAVPLLEQSRVGRADHVLKLSAAFGGANAALVLTRSAVPSALVRAAPTYVTQVGKQVFVTEPPERASLVEPLGVSLERLARLDDLALLVVGAVLRATAGRAPGWLAEAGLVVQTAHATIARNQLFFRRVLERGAASAEPRRFPGTSPNLAAGEASILLGVHGPVLTLGGAPGLGDQASVLADDLVRSGRAPAAVVVHVDEGSDIATLVERAANPLATEIRSGAWARVVERAPLAR